MNVCYCEQGVLTSHFAFSIKSIDGNEQIEKSWPAGFSGNFSNFLFHVCVKKERKKFFGPAYLESNWFSNRDLVSKGFDRSCEHCMFLLTFGPPCRVNVDSSFQFWWTILCCSRNLCSNRWHFWQESRNCLLSGHPVLPSCLRHANIAEAASASWWKCRLYCGVTNSRRFVCIGVLLIKLLIKLELLMIEFVVKLIMEVDCRMRCTLQCTLHHTSHSLVLHYQQVFLHAACRQCQVECQVECQVLWFSSWKQ